MPNFAYMSSSCSPPRAPGKEPVVPDVPSSSTHPSPTPSPESKKRRLEPVNDMIVYSEPSHV
jgi:hypothetical protein